MHQCFKRLVHHDQVWLSSRMQRWFNLRKSSNRIPHVNTTMHKNYMVISIDTQNGFNKILPKFRIKNADSYNV
jgi:hypothetical protein